MQKRLLAKFIGMPFGIALLIAGLFFVAGPADPYDAQVIATPTQDRLAKPTLPASPSQADHGAQDYWLYCLPCHGERGQGLTEEFRQTYPPEENNCWESGCHGNNPYQYGFKLPTKVPAVIGDASLGKFSDAAQLHSYIRATMPYWNPGSLSEEESWKITAFLLRENHLWNDETELNGSNATDVKIPRAAFLTPVTTPPPADSQNESRLLVWAGLGGMLVLLVVLIFALRRPKIQQ